MPNRDQFTTDIYVNGDQLATLIPLNNQLLKTDPIKFNEVILNDCWLGGDETIRTDDSKFLGLSGVLSGIIEVKEAELKKL